MKTKIRLWVCVKKNERFYVVMQIAIDSDKCNEKLYRCNAMPFLNHAEKFQFANFVELGLMDTVKDKKEFLKQVLSQLKRQNFEVENLYVEVYNKHIIFEDYINMIS